MPPDAFTVVSETAQGSRRADTPLAALDAAFEMTRDAVFFVSASGSIWRANAAAIRLTGYSRGRLCRMRLAELLADTEIKHDVAAESTLAGVGPSRPRVMKLRRSDGRTRRVRLEMRSFEERGQHHIVAVARLCTASTSGKATNGAAERDYLTGLFTRAALEQHVRRIEKRAVTRRTRIAVLFVDIDSFKQVNDRGGHRAGDAVLESCGRRLLACVRPDDFVARYGGDEFVVIIESIGRRRAVERIASRIAAELAAPLEADGRAWRISASVGLAIGYAASSVQALIDAADQAMYASKRARLINLAR